MLEKLKQITLLVILVLTPLTCEVQSVKALSSTQDLTPISFTTTSGSTGGQPVSAMAVKDQSGKEDNPENYVTFTTPGVAYSGIQVFQLPRNISNSSVQTIALKVNYKGLAITKQIWSWYLYSWKEKTWIKIGTNQGAKANTWKMLNFQTTKPVRFINSSGRIRVMLSSSNPSGNAKIDYEAIQLTYQSAATNTYYVATNGNDTNPGTLELPWLTVQKCLDQIQPGDTCEIFGGTYNEALVLKKSGTQASRITIKNYNNQTVTVNSGSRKTIVTGGRIDYYTIDGLRLISNFTPADQSDVSIELGKNVPFSTTSKTVGNHGFVFRKCYVEGAIHFYGHNNLMENCELNGKNIYYHGIMDNFATSFDNIYQNNIIYNYLSRAVYSMTSTDNILIKGNTIHDVLFGIDCDGASVPVTRCKVINNHIYNIGIKIWGAGIFLEDCFDCLVQGNTVHDIQIGTGIFAINYGNGSSIDWHTFNNIEYRNQNTNTSIINNVIYNYITNAGLTIKAVNGLVIKHNTFYNTGTLPSIALSSDYDDAGVVYCSKNETITNNIFFKGGPTWSCTTTGNIITGNFTGNPLFVNPPKNLHLRTTSPACTAGVGGTYAGAFPCQ